MMEVPVGGSIASDALLAEFGENQHLVTRVVNMMLGSGAFVVRNVADDGEEAKTYFVRQNTEDMLRTQKINKLDAGQRSVYQVIKDSGRDGAWIRDINNRSNVHKTAVKKAINSLIKESLIKLYKNPLSKAKKMYMLFELEPNVDAFSIWYHNQEFDSTFASTVIKQIKKLLENSPSPLSMDEITLKLCAVLEQGTNEVLSAVNVNTAVEALVDEGVVSVDSTSDSRKYLYVQQSIPNFNGLTHTPCGICPVFNLCHEGGTISPQTCIYFDDLQW